MTFRLLARTPLLAGWAVAVVIVLAGSFGCATQHTPAVWVGATFDELQRAFGDPEAVLINLANNRVYVFREIRRENAQDGTKLTYGDGEIVMPDVGCAVLFELIGKTVSSWDWQGEQCEAWEIPLPYQVRQPPP